MNELNAEIAANIKQYMHKHSIKQLWLAHVLGIQPSTMSQKLSGKHPLYLDEYLRICKALNVDITCFIPRRFLNGNERTRLHG